MATNNIIPSVDARGRFEASAPFDVVVKQDVYYTVEAIRNIHEMESLKLDLYSLVFLPAGVLAADFPAKLEQARSAGGKVLVLLDNADIATYVLTNYLTSWPLVDGVSYERMCMVVDLGPCHPDLKDIIAKEIEHVKNHVETSLGITSTVTLGTIPTLGYVSADQAAAFENNRKAKITDSSNDVARIRLLQEKVTRHEAYILELEAALANRP